MRLGVSILLFAAMATTALACKDDEAKPAAEIASNSPPGAPASGSSSSSSSDASTDGSASSDAGTCTTATVATASIAQNNVNDTVPTGTGGTIPNGTYDLTLDDVYVGLSGLAGPTGVTTASTIVVDGTAFARVEKVRSAGGTSTSTAESGTISTSTPNGVIALTCPLSVTQPFTYTVGADNATLILYVGSEGRTYKLR